MRRAYSDDQICAHDGSQPEQLGNLHTILYWSAATPDVALGSTYSVDERVETREDDQDRESSPDTGEAENLAGQLNTRIEEVGGLSSL